MNHRSLAGTLHARTAACKQLYFGNAGTQQREYAYRQQQVPIAAACVNFKLYPPFSAGAASCNSSEGEEL
jgi:hypothetical protein